MTPTQMLTPAASTFTLLFELFSLKVKYLIFFLTVLDHTGNISLQQCAGTLDC